MVSGRTEASHHTERLSNLVNVKDGWVLGMKTMQTRQSVTQGDGIARQNVSIRDPLTHGQQPLS